MVLKTMNGWVCGCWKTARCLIDSMNKTVMVPQGCHQHNLNHPGPHKRSFQDSSTSSALAAIPSCFPTINSIFLIIVFNFCFESVIFGRPCGCKPMVTYLFPYLDFRAQLSEGSLSSRPDLARSSNTCFYHLFPLSQIL